MVNRWSHKEMPNDCYWLIYMPATALIGLLQWPIGASYWYSQTRFILGLKLQFIVILHGSTQAPISTQRRAGLATSNRPRKSWTVRPTQLSKRWKLEWSRYICEVVIFVFAMFKLVYNLNLRDRQSTCPPVHLSVSICHTIISPTKYLFKYLQIVL